MNDTSIGIFITIFLLGLFLGLFRHALLKSHPPKLIHTAKPKGMCCVEGCDGEATHHVRKNGNILFMCEACAAESVSLNGYEYIYVTKGGR